MILKYWIIWVAQDRVTSTWNCKLVRNAVFRAHRFPCAPYLSQFLYFIHCRRMIHRQYRLWNKTKHKWQSSSRQSFKPFNAFYCHTTKHSIRILGLQFDLPPNPTTTPAPRERKDSLPLSESWLDMCSERWIQKRELAASSAGRSWWCDLVGL